MDDILKNKIKNLADTTGVYFFKNQSEQVIYIGKAKNLKKRIKNHFQKPNQHGFDFISQVADIDLIQTSNEKEALLLEREFIKKIQPRWNTEWKDDKNYFYIALSADDFPRVRLTHQPNPVEVKLPRKKSRGSRGSQTSTTSVVTATNAIHFGPFVSGREVKELLKEIRKALPYRTCKTMPKKPCFYCDLALCPAPCANKTKKIKENYNQTITLLRIILSIYQGKSICLGETSPKFGEVSPRQTSGQIRIEGYDISNLGGTLATGSMVVFDNNNGASGKIQSNKNEYRKFKIKAVQGQNDVAAMTEILKRRIKHQEWPAPDLILIDGGKGQLKAAKKIDIPTIALAKIGSKDGKLFTKFSKNYAKLSKLPKDLSNLFLQIRDESHRFAIGYNKQRRAKNLKIK